MEWGRVAMVKFVVITAGHSLKRRTEVDGSKAFRERVKRGLCKRARNHSQAENWKFQCRNTSHHYKIGASSLKLLKIT